VAKVGETKTRLPRRTSLPRISERARRMKHQSNTHVFCATDLIESLSALNGGSSHLSSKKKRSKRKKGRSPHSSYSTPYKPRWRVNLVGACMWKQ